VTPPRTKPVGSPGRGFTFVECAVAAGLFILLVGILCSLQSGSSKQAGRTLGENEAVRSVLVGLEQLRADLGHMAFADPEKELVIEEDGRVMTVQIPMSARDAFWNLEYRRVRYSLEYLPGDGSACALIRDDNGNRAVVRGCILQDVRFRYVPAGELSARQAYLEVLLIGMGAKASEGSYAASPLIPLPLLVTPKHFPLPRSPR
jgi:hypothetical protein